MTKNQASATSKVEEAAMKAQQMRSAEQLLMSDNTFARKAKRVEQRKLAHSKMEEIKEIEMLPAIRKDTIETEKIILERKE